MNRAAIADFDILFICKTENDASSRSSSFDMNRAAIISFTVVPMITSLFSMAGSGVIIVMIFMSQKKFGDPYRRIIFGISFFDMLQSLAIFFKIFKTTPDQPNAWIALGHQTSCIPFAGLNGALFYNVSLNIYLVCLITKHNMTSTYFRSRIEPFLHGTPIIWAFTSASIIVGTGHMNPAYAGECLIAPYPVNCLKDPDVECIRGQHTDLYRTLFRIVPTFASFIAVSFTLGVLWWTVTAQEARMDRHRFNRASLSLVVDDAQMSGRHQHLANATQRIIKRAAGYLRRMYSSTYGEEEEGEEGGCTIRGFPIPVNQGQGQDQGSTDSFASLRSPRRRSLRRDARRGRHFLIQAFWFTVTFILAHICPVIVVCTEWGGGKPPFVVLIIANIFVPLQGLFNIIIYTRPHVRKEQRRNPRLGWWAAFRIVVASGGDDDDERTNQFRRRGGGSALRRRSSALSRASRGTNGRTMRTARRDSASTCNLPNSKRRRKMQRKKNRTRSTYVGGMGSCRQL